MELDRLDRRILELLQGSEMLSPRVSMIARSLGSTNATVYRRIEAMKKEGVIIGHSTKVDHVLLGNGIEALVYIKLKPLQKDDRLDVSRKISNMKGVSLLLVPVGKWSYIILTRQKGIAELNSFIEEDLGRFPMDEVLVEIISKVLKE